MHSSHSYVTVRLGDQATQRLPISSMVLSLSHTLNWSLSQVFLAQSERRELNGEFILYVWLSVTSPWQTLRWPLLS